MGFYIRFWEREKVSKEPKEIDKGYIGFLMKNGWESLKCVIVKFINKFDLFVP